MELGSHLDDSYPGRVAVISRLQREVRPENHPHGLTEITFSSSQSSLVSSLSRAESQDSLLLL